MMKAAIIFTLLLTTVLCRPARRTFSSSESSEEQVKPARAKGNRAPVQRVRASDDSSVMSEEEAVVDLVFAVKSAITDILSESTALPEPSATPDTASDQSPDDADDEEDDSDDTEENESDEDESGEPSTPSPVTGTTLMVVVGTEEPTAESTADTTTVEPITATVVTDQGRGDSLLRFPSDYKSTLYGEDKSYTKGLSPYKTYEVLDGAKRMAYDVTNGNEVEKGLRVYKALQVHADLLEGDTSTPEVESQGLDTSSPDQEPASPKQALLPNLQEQEVSFSSPSDAAPTDSSSATDEQEAGEESTASPSESASARDESEDSEDATATPGAADSQSDESDSVEGDSEEEGALVPVNTTDMPMLAK